LRIEAQSTSLSSQVYTARTSTLVCQSIHPNSQQTIIRPTIQSSPSSGQT